MIDPFTDIDPLTDKVLSAMASVKHIHREQISLESSLQSLGFDSLDKVTLLFELERQFQISISDEEGRTIRNVHDVVEGVARLVGNASVEAARLERKQ